jgi:hypothetical protein
MHFSCTTRKTHHDNAQDCAPGTGIAADFATLLWSYWRTIAFAE